MRNFPWWWPARHGKLIEGGKQKKEAIVVGYSDSNCAIGDGNRLVWRDDLSLFKSGVCTIVTRTRNPASTPGRSRGAAP
jgi:hypothetical protein